MHRFAHILVAISLLSGQIVAASPREDAESIMESVGSIPDTTQRMQRFVDRYVENLTEQLAKHSVRVVDQDRFAEMLPIDIVEPWLQRWREDYATALMGRYTPAQLSQFAAYLRESKENPSSLNSGDETDLVAAIEMVASEEYSEAVINVLSVVVPMIWSEGLTTREMKRSMPPLTEAPYLVDILETDGIFSFPNRIWRRNLIASIRNGP